MSWASVPSPSSLAAAYKQLTTTELPHKPTTATKPKPSPSHSATAAVSSPSPTAAAGPPSTASSDWLGPRPTPVLLLLQPQPKPSPFPFVASFTPFAASGLLSQQLLSTWQSQLLAPPS